MSSSTRKYDVFLSFRGADTRTNFTSHLFHALENKSIKTYMDCLLDRGEDVWPALAEAIEDSYVSIVVFSENYASSKWCLKELVKILQCRKDHGQVLIPVFHETDPSDIRKQRGSFEKAFAKHERDIGDKDSESKKQKIRSWRDALTEAANISGWGSRNQDETQLIRSIVDDVLRKRSLRHPIELKGLVGTEEICKNVELLMGKYKVIGIWGMPGIGKTTIAKVLFAKLFPQFDKACFIANVKEYSHDRLLSEILKEEISIPNVVGFSYDMKRVGNKNVFIVLDDVDSSDQLGHLCREFHDLSGKSRLIITTRDRQLLVKEAQWIHEVNEWNNAQSLQLFCLEAFKESHPQEGFEAVSRKAVEYAGGIPLALKVLGSCLRSKPIELWESTLEKLKKYPNQKIQSLYKVSYDGLDQLEKKIFLDIAFFFKGERKDHVLSILEACRGLEARCEIPVLQDKALITISHDTIEMHELLQKMAFEIVRQESEKDPAKRSRLRDTEEVCATLKNNKGTDAIEGIALDLSDIEEMHLSAGTFKKMNNLRFLKLYKPSDQCSGNSNIYFPRGLEPFSDKLAYLEWNGYPLESLPQNFCAKLLVEIRMPHSQVKQLWEGEQELGKLERVDLSECNQLKKLPDLSRASRLKWVNLSGCESLRVLHSSVLSSNTLVTLILDRCTNLRCVKGEKHLESLETISVIGCSSLEEFAVSSNLIESLDLSNTRIETLDKSIGRLCKLGCLNLEGSSVKHLPEELSHLTSLKELKLSYSGLVIDKKQLRVLFDGLKSLQVLHLKDCSNLFEFPTNISALSKLQELRLDGSSVERLPTTIKQLQELEILSLKNCSKLQSLPELPLLIHEFYVEGCTLLKSVSNLKTFAREMVGKTKHITFNNSLNLDQDSLGSITKSLYLTMMSAAYRNVSVRRHRGGHNYNSVEACFPGSKVPWEFTYRKLESSSVITELPDSELLGFIYCVVVSSPGTKKDGAKIRCQCQLAGGPTATWLNKATSELNSDHVYVWYDPLHCDNVLKFHPSNVCFEFSVTTDKGEVDGSIHIKECGVHLISFSAVESVLQELELHLPIDSADEENLYKDKAIENYSAQLDNNIEGAKYSEDNPNLLGQQLIIHPEIHDPTVEESFHEKPNEPIRLDKSKCRDHTSRIQQKENLVQQTVDARKWQELPKEEKNVLAQPADSTIPPYVKIAPKLSSRELRRQWKEVAKQAKIEGGSARATQAADLSLGTSLFSRSKDKGKGIEYIHSDLVPISASPPIAQRHEEITFPLKDPQVALELLKDFDASATVPDNSVWNKRFQTTEFVDKHVLNPYDHSIMKGLGGPALCRWLEVQALRSVGVARYAELEFEAAAQSVVEKEEELRLVSEEKAKMEETLKRMEDRISHVESLEKRVGVLNSQVASWKSKYEEAKKKLEDKKYLQALSLQEWLEKEASWKARESELKTEAVAQLVSSFENCMLQVYTLYPNIDLSRLGAFKEIRNGEIVSPSDSEEMESEEDTPALGNVEDGGHGDVPVN